MSIFSGLFRSRDKPQNSYDSPSYSYFFGRSNSGKRVSDRTAMQHTVVYACVRVLSEAIAQLPLHVYKYTNNGKERVPMHPLYFLLHDQPNPEMTSFIFRETLMSHLLIYGNAYAQIIRNGRGEVIGLYPLMSDRIKVDRDERNRLVYVYSRYDEANPNFKVQGDIILRQEDVLHIPGLGFDGLVGYSPIAMAKNAIGISLACEEYGASFFGNGASPSGVLEHPGVIKNPERVRNAWQKAYGSGNAHKVAVIEEGMKYTPISIMNICTNISAAVFGDSVKILEWSKPSIGEVARSNLPFVGEVVDLLLTILMIIPVIIIALAMIAAAAIIMVKLVLRSLELSLLIVVSPAFFACYSSEITKPYFKNFIMTFIQCAVQIVFISVIYAISSNWLIKIGTVETQVDAWIWFLTMLPKALIALAIAIMMVKPPKVLTNLVQKN